jgi:hypothetical protein
MGFVDYRVGLAFVHKGFVVESKYSVPWMHADFLEKGRSMGWVRRTHFFLVVDGILRIEATPQHEGAPRMEFVLQWKDAPQH